MLTDEDHAALAALAQFAADHPLDFRELLDPVKGPELAEVIGSLYLRINTLMVAYSHDRLPPTWRPFRHLSVSDGGKSPDDAVFHQIAAALGMGTPETWDADLLRDVESASPIKLVARHAFCSIRDS